MDAFEKLGTICLVLSIMVMLPFIWLFKSNFLLMGLMVIAFIPLFWIAGLNFLEFFTKPFSEKGMKGIFTWVISIVLAIVVYACFGVVLYFIINSLLHP